MKILFTVQIDDVARTAMKSLGQKMKDAPSMHTAVNGEEMNSMIINMV